MQNIGHHADWMARLEFEIPIGNRTACARHVRAKLESEEAARQLELINQTILMEVSKAVRAVEVAQRRVRATRRAVEAMKRTLEGEQARLELGVGIVRDVLEAQDDLAQVERDFYTTVFDLYLARTELAYAKGTVLDDRAVEIVYPGIRGGYSEPRLGLSE